MKTEASKNKKSKKINISYVVPMLHVGGAERQLCELVKNLDKEKFRPIVCCIMEKGYFFEELQKHSIEACCLNAKSKRNLISHLITILRLITLMRREKVKVVQTWGFNAGVLGKVAAKIAKVPVMVNIEHSTGEWQESHFKNLINRILLLVTDKTISVAERQKQFLVRNKGYDVNKVEVIYNGVDLSYYDLSKSRFTLRAELAIPPNAPVVGILAALRPEKAHTVFLQAAKKVLEIMPATYFLIVGDGQERERLEHFSEELGISKRVIFTGFRADTVDILQLFDVSVLSSFPVVETFPMTILESMAMAKPVVVTDVGGLSEMVINDRTGLVVPPNNPELLAKGIIRILKDPVLARKMGEAGRKLIEENFTIEKMVEGYQMLYERLLAANE